MRKGDINIIFPSKESVFNNVKKQKKNDIKPDGMKIGTLRNNRNNTGSSNRRQETDKIIKHEA